MCDIFGFDTKKPLKLSLHGKQDKKILRTILQNIILQNIINLYVRYIRVCWSSGFQDGGILQDVSHSPNSTIQEKHGQDTDHGQTYRRKTHNINRIIAW